MNNKKAVLAVASLVLVSGSVMAQEAPKSNLAVRAGIGYLLNKDARDLTKSSGLSLGVSYILPSTFLESLGALVSVDLDWTRVSGNGNRIDTFALDLVARKNFSTSKSTTGPVPYYGLGLGIASSEVRSSELVNTGGSSGGSVRRDTKDTGLRIGGKALVGVEFGGRWFVEGAYNLNGSVSGTRADSLSLSVGIRF